MKKKKKESKEPFWWALFAVGGTMAAIFLPVHIFIFGIAVPMGWMDPEIASKENLRNLLGNPIVKIYLVALIALPLFHWAHRFRFTVHDLGLKVSQDAVAFLCYSTAVLGSVATVLILLLIP